MGATPAVSVHVYVPRSGQRSISKAGVIVTKKVGGAVIRNRLRRRCKAILHDVLHSTAGRWLVVQCKPPAARLPFSELRSELTSALATAVRGKAP
jgi:ribonuclease P protein component